MPTPFRDSKRRFLTVPRTARSRLAVTHCLALPLFAALWLAVSSGCTRTMYREQADAEVYAAVQQKTNDPRWALENYTIAVNAHSRMYDGYNPDREPLPPDDPAAHELMHYIDDMSGYPCWHRNGDTPFVENPEWYELLPRNQKNQVILDTTSSVQLGLLHSRAYQRELEDLYLSALDVTFERFRFDVQFFAGNDTFFTADGIQRTGGESSSLLTSDTNFQARKLFASGGEAVVNLANSLVWQFSGPDTSAATTLLDFSMVQPLLRGGVKTRVLERLTLSERTLLGNVRLMERYRGGFYMQVITGRDPGQGPSRRGGVLGAGLTGFSGLSGGFGGVATGGINQNAAGAAGGAGAGVAGGFIGLLQTQLQIRNQEANVAALADSLAQLQAAYDASRIDRFQVDFGRQALYNARSQLLTSKTNFQNTQDNFKITLGLPPNIEFQLDDPLLDAFELIDPIIPPLQNQLTAVQVQLGQRILAIREGARALAERPADAATVQAQLAALRQGIATANAVQRSAVSHFGSVRLDIDDIQAAIPERRQMFKRLQSMGIYNQSRGSDTALPGDNSDENPAEGLTPETAAERDNIEKSLKNPLREPPVPPADPNALPAPSGQAQETTVEIAGAVGDKADEFDMMIAQLEALPAKLIGELKHLAGGFQRYPALLAEIDRDLAAWQIDPMILQTPAGQERMNVILGKLPDLMVELSGEILELSLIQARARAESVTLLPLEMLPADALAIASRNRRDWMNARANLVDAYRAIEFTANDLEADLNIVFGGDIRTVGDNPVDFRSATGRLRVGVQFDAPLTRVAERNNYRQSLIEYQQARREYYAFIDRVSQTLRSGLRQIELDQANFELRRAAVRVAIDQVEVSRLRLREPPKPAVVSVFSPTTARDLVSSLSDLLNVQNDFMSVWVNYEVERLNLDYNLDTMQLDERGMWIDPGSAVGLNGLKMLRDCPEDAPDNWDRAVNEERPDSLKKPSKSAPRQEEIPAPTPSSSTTQRRSRYDGNVQQAATRQELLNDGELQATRPMPRAGSILR